MLLASLVAWGAAIVPQEPFEFDAAWREVTAELRAKAVEHGVVGGSLMFVRGGEELGIHEQIAQAERAIRRQGAEDLREEGAGGGHIHWSRGRGEAGRLGEGDAKRVGGQTGLGAEGGEAQSKGDEE